MNANIAALLYLVSGVLFILSLRGLSSPATSQAGARNGMIGMAIAILTTLWMLWDGSGGLDVATLAIIGGGIVVGGIAGGIVAQKIKMTAMPQLVAFFHSLVGLAAVLVAAAALYAPQGYGIVNTDMIPQIGDAMPIKLASIIELSLGSAIGALTFTGSVIAFLKLNGNMSGAPIILPARHLINIAFAVAIVALVVMMVQTNGTQAWMFWALTVIALVLGVTLIIPIGGADMPVVVSMLNSYSGWAAAALGFTLENNALIITGSLVGSSGAILSYIMCKAMNRSFISVILGGFGGETAAAATGGPAKPVKIGSADDAAFIMKNASKVIIVPGYGMAVAQAQHALKEMAEKLKAEGVEISYAIHPVAGRMPGHMNVLLAEANVPYEQLSEMEEVNPTFPQTDVALIIGANDVVNPAAKTTPGCPIYGMPILDVAQAGNVIFLKRSMRPGFAGIENELLFDAKTTLLFGDAKASLTKVVGALKAL